MQELRRANEMYLDVRVENSKLKDQITQMQLTVDSHQSETSIRQNAPSSKSISKTPKINMPLLDSDMSMMSTQSIKQPPLREIT